MVDIVFERHDQTISMAASGHAMYAEPGHDIVCAACSTLAYTLAIGLQALEEEGYCEMIRCNIDDGSDGGTYIEFSRTPRSEAIAEAIRLTALNLMHAYPKNVRLTTYV